ncbi:hypothetical protein CL689_01160 [Candidatus Saccharibacteria bacterium]|nr:hypothetical protein [Candidatus Saccharibacteria bacterium]MBJ58455.1 hypothetical protein [Candidatus Saccharibacteria bacterium]MBQ68659.1 hypothetical protein [Candidatus Saccharibacteria bacterium]
MDKQIDLSELLQRDSPPEGFILRHRFAFLIVGTLVISLILVIVAMVIYNVSGAAQLDLSRPGYQSVSNQVERGVDVGDFSASGQMTAETIEEFIELYDTEAKKATAVDAFNGDPLNPEVLEFTEVAQ